VKDWWPALAAIVWLSFVQAVAGVVASFFAGLTGLIVGLFCLWEVGSKMRRERDSVTLDATRPEA
jgi:hypothetical protein